MKDLLLMSSQELVIYLNSISSTKRKEIFEKYNKEDINYIFNLLDDVSPFLTDVNFEIELLEKSDLTEVIKLKEQYLLLSSIDIVEEIETFDNYQILRFLNLFTCQELTLFLEYIDATNAANYTRYLCDIKVAYVLSLLDRDDAVDILNELPDKADVLMLMDNKIKTELENLSSYDETEAGSIMDTSFIVLDGNKDVKEAMKVLINEAPNVSSISTLFVTLNNWFYGTLDLKTLIVSKSPCLVKDITNTMCKTVQVDEKIEEVIKIVDEYDIYSLPVLDEKTLMGIITIDDTLNRLNEEREEDYKQLAGLSNNHENKVMKIVKNRLPWLILLCFLDVLVCLIVSSFEDIINEYTLLIIFEPIILGLAGNVGTQSLAVCIRKLSANDLNNSHKKIKHILKEGRNSLLIGVIIAILLFVTTYLYVLLINPDNTFEPIYVSLVNAISIIAVITVSGLFGCLIPILCEDLHIDPSAASGPVITTINDIVALLIYFTLSTIFLIGG